MGTYVKRPVEVEAIRLSERNIYEMLAWANSIQPADKQVRVVYNEVAFDDPTPGQTVRGLLIPTKEGPMLCSLGDYLIKEPFPTDDRMFYPCKPDMFELTYMEK